MSASSPPRETPTTPTASGQNAWLRDQPLKGADKIFERNLDELRRQLVEIEVPQRERSKASTRQQGRDL